MMFILPANKPQEDLEQIIQQVFSVIEKAGGKIIKKEVFAKQRLGYPIKKETQGVFILSEFDLDPSALKAIDLDLRHLTGLLRHQILKIQVKTQEQIEKVQAMQERAAARRMAESEKAKIEQAKEKEAAAPAVPQKKKEKVDIAELDKKLEELLEDPLLKE